MTRRAAAATAAVICLAGMGLAGPQDGPAGRVREAAALVAKRASGDALKILEPMLEDPAVTGDPAVLTDALIQTAAAYFQLNEYPKALRYYERARDASQPLGRTPIDARIAYGLAQVHKNQGSYARSLDHAREALDLYRRADDEGGAARAHVLIGSVLDLTGRHYDALDEYRAALPVFEATNQLIAYRVLNEIGISLKNAGDYRGALDHYARALAGQRTLPDPVGEAITLNNLGNVHRLLGQDDQAIEAFQRALALSRAQNERRGQSILLGNLGEVLLDRGRHARAIEYFDQQLALTLVLGNRNEEANARKSLGDAYLAAGDLTHANIRFTEALGIQREIGARLREGSTLLSLADIALRQGRSPEGERLARDALGIARGSAAPELEWKAHLMLGRAARLQGRAGEAAGELRASTAIVNDLRANIASDAAKIGFLDERQEAFRELAAVLMAEGRHAEALEAAEAGRARAFADLLEQRHVRAKPAEQPALEAVRAALRDVRVAESPGAATGTSAEEGGRQRRSSALRQSLDALRGAGGELASLLTAESPTHAEMTAIAARLNATIVEYLVTDRQLLAWAIAPTGTIHGAISDVTRERLEALAAEVRRGMDATPPAPLRQPLRELHRLAVAPLAQWLPRTASQLVVVVPHGPLALVPFAALEDARGTPLVNRYTLAFAPAISVYRYTPAKRQTADAGGPAALVIADPAPPDDSGLKALPWARQEGRRVAARLGRGVRLLSGKDATEATIKRAAATPRILHFATHGLISTERPLSSSLLLAAGGGEDGYLRVDEIFGLPLAANLVVLSGCSTGLGKPSGDGIIGLARAFIYAGTPAVVVSQWDVSDRATAFLMDRFYAELRRGAGTAAALRAAQLQTRRQYPSPAYWGAFLLIGEPM